MSPTKRILTIDMLPYFYQAHLLDEAIIELDEDTSHHVAQVLRMRSADELNLTDGKGHLLQGKLVSVSKRTCTVAIENRAFQPLQGRTVHLAIAPLKNSSRFEWFIEKATELGVASILPIRTTRTEKDRLRMDRIRQVAIAAMLQSQQVWLPALSDLIPLSTLLAAWSDSSIQRLIAHCLPVERSRLSAIPLKDEVGLLIGPEGDFTSEEIQLAREAACAEVQLGESRLRTETAGVIGAAILRLQC